MSSENFGLDDESELTISRASLGAKALSTVSDDAATTLVASFDSGENRVLNARLVVGRAPSADMADTIVTIADLSVSKTHLAIDPAPGACWVTDLHSRNGVTLELASGDQFDLVPGRPTFAAIGTRIVFGGSSALISVGSAVESATAQAKTAARAATPPASAPPKQSSEPSPGSLIDDVPLT